MGKVEHDLSWQAPQILDKAAADKLAATDKVFAVVDQIQTAIGELYDIKYPEQKDSKAQAQFDKFVASYGDLNDYGNWVFYPWSGYLVHMPDKDDLRALRTSRNRNLITAKEQQKLYQSTILVIGMSVGSNVVEALVAQGIGGKLILADMDALEPSNFNRIRASYHEVGVHKVDAIAKKISEIDPYLEQVHYHDGVNDEVLEEVIAKHRPDVIIDEMDNVQMKLKLRQRTQAERLAVIMAADDGDNILLDVERYDKHENLPILHGKIPAEVMERILTDKQIPRPELGMMIGRYFVGFENTPLRMFQSLGEVGKTLPSWPQLGGAAALAGIILAYCSKKIILDQPLTEGRFVVGPDEQLDPVIQTPEYKAQLQAIIDHLSNN